MQAMLSTTKTMRSKVELKKVQQDLKRSKMLFADSNKLMSLAELKKLELIEKYGGTTK